MDQHVRPGSNDAHFAAKHVDKLREFIKASPPQPAARGKDVNIV
jgi:hypothetical protein